MQIKILILEDSTEERNHLELLLGALGHNQETFIRSRTVDGAIALLEDNEDVNLAILDIRIGNDRFGGIRVGEFIKKHRKSLPFIYVTSYGRENELVEKASKTNPSGYLDKPITEAALKMNLNRVLPSKEEETSLSTFPKGRLSYVSGESLYWVGPGSDKKQREIKNLLYAKAHGSYTTIYYKDGENVKSDLVTIRLGLVQNKICLHPKIIRVSKTHILSINHITDFNTSTWEVLVEDKWIRISYAEAKKALFKK